jgi:hypothetical protein
VPAPPAPGPPPASSLQALRPIATVRTHSDRVVVATGALDKRFMLLKYR